MTDKLKKNISLYRLWQLFTTVGVAVMVMIGTIGSFYVLALAGRAFVPTTAHALSVGNLYKGPNSDAVYYVANGKKHVFPDSKTYFSWFPNYSGIQEVSIATLDQYQTGKPVFYRPGTKLVTHPNTAKVYAVEPGGNLRHLADEATAEALFGSSWGTIINDVHELTFGDYSLGDQLTSAKHPVGSLIIKDGEPRVYYYDGDKLRPFADGLAFDVHKFKWEYIRVVQSIGAYTIGNDVRSFETDLFNPARQGTTTGSQPTTTNNQIPGGTTGGNIGQQNNDSPQDIAASDTTGPTLSSVQASGISENSATISWDVNESSDGKVEYGTSNSYGQKVFTTSNKAAHSFALTNLDPTTTYHYRVVSCDSADNCSTSDDKTFSTTDTPDTTKPSISGVSVGSITEMSVIINWTTDEISDSKIEYGTTNSYGSEVTELTKTTDHSIYLSDLDAGITYYYRITSCDAANNCGISEGTTFDTVFIPPPVVISNVTVFAVTSNVILVTYDTDIASASLMSYGITTAMGSESENLLVQTNHFVAAQNLSPETIYYFTVTSCDTEGDCATSDVYTATTAADTTPPLFQNVEYTSTATTATITWATSEIADESISYGVAGFTAPELTTVTGDNVGTQHTMTLTGLLSNTTYEYHIHGCDTVGNCATEAKRFLVTGDGTPPVISGVTTGTITKNAAVIQWTTDEVSDSTVEYGVTASYGSQATSAALVQPHSFNVTGLASGTQYHYRVVSCDGDGNCTSSADKTVTTLVGDDIAPVLSSVSVSRVSMDEATISWNTSEVATSKVEYGLSNSYGFEVISAGTGTSHSLSIKNLPDSTTFNYRAVSCDVAGNCSFSGKGTFITTNASMLEVLTVGTTEFYVDPDKGVDDSSHGSIIEPFRTINYAQQHIASLPVTGGYTTYLRNGIYREEVTNWASGIAGRRNTIMSYPGEKVIITGLDIKDDWVEAGKGLYKRGMTDTSDSYRGVLEDGIVMHEAQHPNGDGAYWEADSTSISTLTDSALSSLSVSMIESAYVEILGEGVIGQQKKITSFDPSTNTITFESLSRVPSYKRYRLIKSLELLDSTGEYFYNFDGAEELYIKTFAGDSPLNHTMEVISRYSGLRFNKDAAAAHYIDIKDIEVSQVYHSGVFIDGRDASTDYPTNITFDNLHIHDTWIGHGVGTNWYSNFKNIIVRDSLIEGIQASGIQFRSLNGDNVDNPVYSYIHNNIIKNTKGPGIGVDRIGHVLVSDNYSEYTGWLSHASGLNTHFSGYITFVNNTVKYASGNSFLSEGNGTNRNDHIIVRNNTFIEPAYYTRCPYSWIKAIWISDTDDSLIEGNYSSTPYSNAAKIDGADRVTMINNVFADVMDQCTTMGGYVVEIDDSSGSDYLGYARGNMFAHNVVEGTYRAGWSITSGVHDRGDNVTGNIVANNIFVTANNDLAIMSVLPSTVNHNLNTYDNNIYYSTGRAITYNRGSATYQDQNAMTIDPKFVSPASGNFNLQSDSPAIDAGMFLPGINDNYVGAAPDIGRYER